MDRRAFFRSLPGVAVAGAAGVASIISAKPRIEDVDGIMISKEAGLIITNCTFTSTDKSPGLVIKQA